MRQKQINISHMQCWVFRLAQTRWNKTPMETAMLFKQHDVFPFIEEFYDTLHMSSYDHALDVITTMLKQNGVLIDTCPISYETKEACAVETMRYMLDQYSQDTSLSFGEALLKFSMSTTYQVLFDFDTAVWKEGPDYLRSLFERALAQQN